MTTINYGICPDADPHRSNPEPHWRLYDAPRDIGPTVIEVQNFDYRDYEDSRFMTSQAYDSEADALLALETYQFLTQLQHTRSADDRLARAIEELANIATTLSVGLDGEGDRHYIAEHTLMRLRELQRELIR